MKKMNFFAAFAVMMVMGNMNANASQFNDKHNEFHMNDKGKVEVRHDGHHNDRNVHHSFKMSRHEAERIRMEEHRRMEEARRRRAHHHHHVVHHNDVVVVDGSVAAGVAAGVAVAALVNALVR